MPAVRRQRQDWKFRIILDSIVFENSPSSETKKEKRENRKGKEK